MLIEIAKGRKRCRQEPPNLALRSNDDQGRTQDFPGFGDAEMHHFPTAIYIFFSFFLICIDSYDFQLMQ